MVEQADEQEGQQEGQSRKYMFRGEECRRPSGKREERYRMLEVDIRKKVKGFSLEIQITSDSRRIGILGASGCGKSMTLKSIAGIETPDEGRILVDGRCLFDRKAKINQTPQQRHLGYLFQNYALFPTMTVADNVAAGLRGRRKEKKKKTGEMLERFWLKGLAERLPGELSGGQQQRVALARIMAYEPELIMLDEPFSALDVYLKEQMQQEMSQMLKSYPGTVILVSHSRDEIYRFSQDLIILDQGSVIAHGDTKALFAEPKRKEAAKLTGCKNFSDIRRLDDHTFEIPDWGVTMRVTVKIPEDADCIGYRAHDFVPVWGEAAENCFPLNVKSMASLPFEDNYYLEPAGDAGVQAEDICWFVQKEQAEQIREKGLPDHLGLQEEKILFLKK